MNCFIWRQNDATRNSIQSVGQANFSHKQLHCKSTKDICDMLINEKQMNWNDFPTTNKRGSCCVKDENGQWVIDNEIPIFTQDREYVEKVVFVG
jgi:tRNA(His) 5'-end guanylyltransferase